MQKVKLISNNISKSFNGFDFVLSNITFEIKSGEVFGITGPNGSGKSTLLKILSRLVTPTSGKVICENNSKVLTFEEQLKLQGFVSPYLTLFEEFKPLEHLEIIFKIRNEQFSKTVALDYLDFFGLISSLDKPIKEFSSGMKQRLKFIMLFLTSPILIFLDEPFTNLDQSGIEKVKSLILRAKSEGKIIVIATNDSRELELCDKSISLSKLTTDEPDFNPSI